MLVLRRMIQSSLLFSLEWQTRCEAGTVISGDQAALRASEWFLFWGRRRRRGTAERRSTTWVSSEPV
eukprot:132897-Prorocentrum_minimum.AAC.2